MVEIDREIDILYKNHIQSKTDLERMDKKRTNPMRGLVRALSIGIEKKEREIERRFYNSERMLYDAVRERPGIYPLNRLTYGPEGQGIRFIGFNWGFDFKVGDITVSPSYYAKRYWGINVIKEPGGTESSVEILDRNDPQYRKFGLSALHLPEGTIIPAGPINFKEEEIPLSEEEIVAGERAVEDNIRRAGIKMPKEAFEESKRVVRDLYPPTRHVDRYFYWQPQLSDEPGKITIDFENLNPSELGKDWESAPTITTTIVSNW